MNTTEFYAKVTSMPSLRHVDEDGAYRIEKSEVLKWLLAQPEVQDWVFFRMKDANVIKYDDLTRTWSGNPDCVKVVAGEFTEAPAKGTVMMGRDHGRHIVGRRRDADPLTRRAGFAKAR